MSLKVVDRGLAQGATASPVLFRALKDHHGLQNDGAVQDLGGSQNLNLLVTTGQGRGGDRVYRPWLTTARLEAMQAARHHLALGGVPGPLRIRTCDDAS